MRCARVIGLAWLALGLWVGGCVHGFSRGELARASGGRDVGCVEVRARHGHDAFAPASANDDAAEPLVEIAFANACARAVTIDLARARVWIYRPGSPSRELGIVDPRGEVRPLLLDADTTGAETLAYSDGDPVASDATLCVALDVIADVASASPVEPVCFGAHDAGAR